MTVFDCHERMSGYTYFGIMDHDEVLIPTRNRSLKQLLVCYLNGKYYKLPLTKSLSNCFLRMTRNRHRPCTPCVSGAMSGDRSAIMIGI